jgi:branched-chain amino acid transport system substrate-binding protein
MKKSLSAFTALSLVASTIAFSGCGSNSSNSNDPSNANLRIGALLALTGDASDVGTLEQSAVYLSAQNASTSDVVIGVEVRDTAGDPETAVKEFQALLDKGVRVFVGPSTSSEVQAVLPLANAAGALLVSESSTAQSLAIANDALYRLSPINTVEAQASVDYIKLRGRSSLVTVSRDDSGNIETVNAVRSAASSVGFSLQPTIVYPTDERSNFETTANQIATEVAAAAQGDISKVGVFISGFDEVSNVLEDVASIESMQGVAFYGSDGVAQNSHIVSSAKSAFYAVTADGVASPLIGVPADKQAEAQTITNEIGGDSPNGFVMNAYDAVQIMANAYRSNSTFGNGGAGDRSLFAQSANGYDGLTGVVRLNSAGDRISANYAIWGVCSFQGLINWFTVGQWTPSSPTAATGTASYIGCPVNVTN